MARQDPKPTRRVANWQLSISSIDHWLERSRPGEELVYAHGHYLVDEQSTAHVRKLIEGGDVKQRRDRAEDGALDYKIIRNRVRVTLPPRPRRDHGIVLCPAMSSLFRKLKECARLGERCPSNKALHLALGFPEETIKWAMRKLVAAELIHSRLVPTSAEPKYRVVTIVATGLQTRLPDGGAR